jgi:hypothetical protein
MEYGIFFWSGRKKRSRLKTSRSEVRLIIPFFGTVFSSFPIWHYRQNPGIFADPDL